VAQEREIKLAVEGAHAGRALLRRAGFLAITRRLFEANTLYDTPTEDLRGRQQLLRVRQVGAKSIVTYKGPPRTTGKHKLREEIEFSVSGARETALVLERLGFMPTFRYEKYRTEFQRPGELGIATLDETPIGTYLELEGQAAWIDRSARRLGFTASTYITKSYGSLYLEYCERLGNKPANMVFPSRAKA
jgi:adenylate cyclase, class 2